MQVGTTVNGAIRRDQGVPSALLGQLPGLDQREGYL